MKYLKIVLIVVIVCVLLYFFFQNVDFHEVISIIKKVNPIYPIVFFIGLFLQFFIRSYRWGILLKPYKNKIPLFTLYNYTVIGFLISTLIPGRVGEPARGILLAQEENIKKSYGLASVVLERLIDIMMVILLFLVSLIFIKDNTLALFVQLKKISYFAFPLMLLIFIIFYLLNTPKVFCYIERLIYFFSKILPSKIRESVVSFIRNFIKGLKLNLSLVDFGKLFLSSSMVWLFLVPFYWFLMQGFNFGVKVTLLETVPYFSLIVASAAIPTPGMAGSFDLASSLGLQGLYKVQADQAAAYTLLAHFLIIMVILIPGLAALWAKGLNFKTIRNLKEKNDEVS